MDTMMTTDAWAKIGEQACKKNSNYTLPANLEGMFFCSAKSSEAIIVQIFVAIMFCTLMAVAIVGNSVVMWIIYKHKVMHYGFNFFLFNMAFADLMIALFNVGSSWTYNLYYDWWYGDMCTLTTFFGIAPTTVSVFSMMALSWDRCQAVVNPLRKRPLSRRRSICFILIIWLISTVTALPYVLAARVNTLYSYDYDISTVSITRVCESPVNRYFEQLLFVLQYAIPFAVVGFTFSRIAVAFAATNVASDNSSKSSSHNRAKNKAVKMLALMVVAFMVSWLPYHLYHTFELSAVFSGGHAKYTYLTIYWMAMSSSAYNPIIYCFANERFRIGFRYVFRWIPLVNCKRENYEYSQLFPDRMRSMAISLQKGRVNSSCLEKKSNTKEQSSHGFTIQSTPDIVQCVMHSEKNKKFSRSALLSCHETP